MKPFDCKLDEDIWRAEGEYHRRRLRALVRDRRQSACVRALAWVYLEKVEKTLGYRRFSRPAVILTGVLVVGLICFRVFSGR